MEEEGEEEETGGLGKEGALLRSLIVRLFAITPPTGPPISIIPR